MTDALEHFRSETREWLEASCPAEMRQPMRTDGDACWGGRRWVFQSEAQRLWLDAWLSEAGQCRIGQHNMVAVGYRVLRQKFCMTDDHNIGLYMKRERALSGMFGDANYHADRWARMTGY